MLFASTCDTPCGWAFLIRCSLSRPIIRRLSLTRNTVDEGLFHVYHSSADMALDTTSSSHMCHWLCDDSFNIESSSEISDTISVMSLALGRFPDSPLFHYLFNRDLKNSFKTSSKMSEDISVSIDSDDLSGVDCSQGICKTNCTKLCFVPKRNGETEIIISFIINVMVSYLDIKTRFVI